MNTKVQPLTEAVYYILLSLTTPMHGYGIMQNVKQITNGRLTIGAGTLYGAINTLLAKKLITEHSVENSKKLYIITDNGKTVLKNEYTRLNELINNGKEILGE